MELGNVPRCQASWHLIYGALRLLSWGVAVAKTNTTDVRLTTPNQRTASPLHLEMEARSEPPGHPRPIPLLIPSFVSFLSAGAAFSLQSAKPSALSGKQCPRAVFLMALLSILIIIVYALASGGARPDSHESVVVVAVCSYGASESHLRKGAMLVSLETRKRPN